MKIAIDVSNKCNLNCKYCYSMRNYGKNWNKNNLSLNKFEFILNNIEERHEINILGGEPFLHPNINEIIDLLKTKKNKKLLFTNFLFDNNIYEKLLKDTDILLAISFHLDFIENKKEFFEKIKNLNLKNIRIHYMITKNNLKEFNKYESEILELKNKYNILQLCDYVVDKTSWTNQYEGFKSIYIDNNLSKNLKELFIETVKLDINEKYDFTDEYFKTFTQRILCKGNLITINIYGDVNMYCYGKNFNIFSDFKQFKRILKNDIFIYCDKIFCPCIDALCIKKIIKVNNENI